MLLKALCEAFRSLGSLEQKENAEEGEKHYQEAL